LDKTKRRVRQALEASAYASTAAFCQCNADFQNPRYVRMKAIEQVLHAVKCLLDNDPDHMKAWHRLTSELGL
jgi:hypothetical protein